MTIKPRKPTFDDLTPGKTVEVMACKGTPITHNGMWFVRKYDGDVFVAGDMYWPSEKWIEVSIDRVRVYDDVR